MARDPITRLSGLSGILGGSLFAVASALFLAPGWLDGQAVSDTATLAAIEAAALTLVAFSLVGLWARAARPGPVLAAGLLLALAGTALLAVYLAPAPLTQPLRQWAQGSLKLTVAGAPLVEVYGLVPLMLLAGWLTVAAAGAREGLLPLTAAVLVVLAGPAGYLLAAPALAAGAGWHWSFALAQVLGPLFGVGQVVTGLALWTAAPAPASLPRRRARA